MRAATIPNAAPPRMRVSSDRRRSTTSPSGLSRILVIMFGGVSPTDDNTGRSTRAAVPSGFRDTLVPVDRDEMLRVLRAFETEGLEYVLIGATAMGFHGLVRATEDVDLFIRATLDNVLRLKRAFRAAYSGDPNVDEIRAEDLLGEYPAVRYYPPSGDLYFDVMTRLGEAASFETVEAEVKEVEGIQVRVATPAALYELKKGTVRPLDRQDAEALRRRFGLKGD
jgi:Nucleotidyl transferase AbiEii toxin, Type IV TA system